MMKTRITSLLAGTAFAFCFLLTCLTQSALAQKNYVTWVKDGDYDQSKQKDEHSGLVPWDYKTNGPIQDTEVADNVKPLVQDKQISFVWVFSQCFGGGMFDELNALGGTQSGVSASTYWQEAYYQVLRPLGNGVNFSTAYIEGLRDITKVAEPMASTAADNDPWGPSNNPTPSRTAAEMQGSEQPVYFTTGAAADALNVEDHKVDGAVILWSGQPTLPLDAVEIRQLVSQFVELGYNKTNIYVLYGQGHFSKTKHLVGEVVETKLGGAQLRAATKKQLVKVMGAIQNDDGIKFVFFFANDHGWNNMRGNDKSRIGGNLYPTDPPSYYAPSATDEVGQGDL